MKPHCTRALIGALLLSSAGMPAGEAGYGEFWATMAGLVARNLPGAGAEAYDEPTDGESIDLALLRYQTGHIDHIEEPADPDERPPTVMREGVITVYERIRFQADRVDLWQSPLADGHQRLWPERVVVVPGPKGPEADRVHLDSRETGLSTVNFRVLLRPRKIVVERLPWPGGSEPVRFRVTLDEIGWFRGSVPRGERWVPVVIWGERLVLDLRATVEGEEITDPRLEAFHLVGRDGGPRAVVEFWDTEDRLRVRSDRLTIHFNASGRFRGFTAGGNTTSAGLPKDAEPPAVDEHGRLDGPLPEEEGDPLFERFQPLPARPEDDDDQR